MVKQSSRDKRSGKGPGTPDWDLDAGYDSGIRTWKDLTFRNVRQAVEHSRYVQLVITFTLIGLFLRFYQITFNSIWLDEAATLRYSKPSFIDIWFITANGEFNPPLFHWIEHFMLYFGNSEFILRFIPAILGTLTIALFYFAGKEFLDRNCGIIIAALLAVSPFHIFYSQDARAYTMMLFFLALALVFYFIALRSNAWKHWALFGLFSALSFWAHFYALIPAICLFGIALALYAGKIRSRISNSIPLFTGAAIFFITILPLLVVMIRLFLIRTSAAPTYGIQGMNIMAETMRQLSGYNDLILMLYLLLFVIGLATLFQAERNRSYLLVVMILVPLFVSWALSYRMPMIPRYLIYLLPFFFMGIGSAYRPLLVAAKTKKVIYIFITVLVIINIPFLVSYYQNPSKDDWRSFSGIVHGFASPGDRIVLIPSYNYQPFDYYYNNSTAGTLEYGADSIRELEEITASAGEHRVFYVVTGDINAVDPQGTMLAWFNGRARIIGQDTGIYLLSSA